MAMRKLFVEVIINTRKAAGNVKLLRNTVNLLRSTLVALFRTGSIALIFGGIRSVIGMVNQLKESVRAVTQELIELNLAGVKTASVLTKGEAGTGGVYEQVSQLAREASTEVGKTAKEIQSGLYTAALAGNTVEESYALTDSAMKMATIAGNNFNSTIDGLIGVSRAFNIESEKIPKLADTITASFTNSKMTLEGFFTAMSYVAPVAATVFGRSEKTIQDTAAALMSLTDQGFSFSKAGVYLRGTLNKISGGTSKAATMFAKYRVNIYESDAKNQRYLNTLLKGQRVLADYYEELNELKIKQYELILAGRESSTAYEGVASRIDRVSAKIGNLASGLDKVFEQFTLTGGKMKPLAEVLDLMSEKIPTEVVSRAFGVRGGMGAAAILGRPELYKSKNEIVKTAMEASDEGISTLDKMFNQVVNTFAITWKRITNTIMASLQVVFDPFIRVASQLFRTLQMGLQSFYKNLESNKEIFKVWAARIGDALIPVFSEAAVNLAGVGQKIGRTFFPGVKEKYTMYRFDEGKVKTEEVQSKTGKVSEKVVLMARSMASMFAAYITSMLATLKPVFEVLAKVIGEALIAYLKTKMEFFKSMGMAIGKSLADAAISAWDNRKKAVYTDLQGNVRVNRGRLDEMKKGSWKDMIPVWNLFRMFNRKSQLDLLDEGKRQQALKEQSSGTAGSATKIGEGILGFMRKNVFGDDIKPALATAGAQKSTASTTQPSEGWIQFDGGEKINLDDFKKFSSNAKKATNAIAWFGKDGTKHMITLAEAVKKTQEDYQRAQAKMNNLLRRINQKERSSSGGGG